MLAAGRALALLRGRSYVLPSDVAEIASDVMSHRLMLSFDAVADGVDPRSVVAQVLAAVPQPHVTTREQPDGQRLVGVAGGQQVQPPQQPGQPTYAAQPPYAGQPFAPYQPTTTATGAPHQGFGSTGSTGTEGAHRP